MKKLLAYDPDTCVAHFTEDDGENIILETKLDAEPMVERNKIARNEGHYDKGCEGWKKYCDIDDVLIYTCLKRGINILRPQESDWKKFFQFIETERPFYKVTDKKAWRPKSPRR